MQILCIWILESYLFNMQVLKRLSVITTITIAGERELFHPNFQSSITLFHCVITVYYMESGVLPFETVPLQIGDSMLTHISFTKKRVVIVPTINMSKPITPYSWHTNRRNNPNIDVKHLHSVAATPFLQKTEEHKLNGLVAKQHASSRVPNFEGVNLPEKGLQ